MLELRLDNAIYIDFKYKNTPNPLSVLTPEFQQLIQYLINSFFGQHFILKALGLKKIIKDCALPCEELSVKTIFMLGIIFLFGAYAPQIHAGSLNESVS